MKKDLTLPLLYQLGLLASIFTIILVFKQQLTNFQQYYYHYLTLLNNLGTTALQNPEGILQAQTIIEQFNQTTNHYTLILFWILPALLIITYFFWKFLTWKKLLNAKLQPYWWRFIITNIIHIGILLITIRILWDAINFTDYSINLEILWIPFIIYLTHPLHYSAYSCLDQPTWFNKQHLQALRKKIGMILLISLGSYAFIFLILLGLIYVLTNYAQGITNINVYIWSIITILLTLGSVYYHHYTIQRIRNYLSIKE